MIYCVSYTVKITKILMAIFLQVPNQSGEEIPRWVEMLFVESTFLLSSFVCKEYKMIYVDCFE